MLRLFDIAILYALLEFLEFLTVFWSTQGTSSSLGQLYFPCFVIHFFSFPFLGYKMDQKGYNVSLDSYL